jgi:SAM-dependent methyltransferase
MKKIISRFIHNIFEKSQFIPGIPGVFINPYFIIRNGLYKSILNNRSYLNGVLLDFGCGSKPYKKLFTCSEYIGLDMVNTGHVHSDSEIDLYYNGKDIPLVDESIDSIFASEVFEHVFNLGEILKELNRVLKNGGYILATTPFIWEEHEIPYDFARYTSFALKQLFESSGFEVVKIEKSTTTIHTLFQLWNAYLYALMFRLRLNFGIRLFLILIFIFPVNLLSIIIGNIKVKNPILFLNHIVVAKKVG